MDITELNTAIFANFPNQSGDIYATYHHSTRNNYTEVVFWSVATDRDSVDDSAASILFKLSKGVDSLPVGSTLDLTDSTGNILQADAVSINVLASRTTVPFDLVIA